VNKKILAVAVSILVLFVVSKVVPLKTVTEDFGTETFSLDSHGPVTTSTTLAVKKGWDVSGNFSGVCTNYQGEDASEWAGDELSFYIVEPPPRLIVVFRSVGV